MKQLTILFILPLFLHAQELPVDQDKVKWLTDYSSALKKSQKEDKNVLLYFTGSDWCAPCKKLKQDLFDTNEFKALSANYVLLYIDIPMNKDLISAEQLEHNKALLPKFNKKSVFPLLKILNSKEKELDELSGYSMNGEIKYHLDLLKKYRG